LQVTSRLALLALAALLLLLPLRGADAASPGPPGSIAVVDGTIRTVDPDGSDLDDTGVTGTSPTWAPAADRIAYVDADGDIAIMDADGSNASKLESGGSPVAADSVVWSPSGTTLAFTASNDVWTVPVDGGAAPTQLTFSSSVADFDPTWSHDGAKIAFVSHRDGNDEIYTMNTDGSDQLRITSSGGDDRAPSWSPDGGAIAFQSDRDGNAQIYEIASGGGPEVRLTNESSTDTAPTWSPNGTQIAFVRDGDLATVGSTPGSVTTIGGGIGAEDPEWGLAFGIISPPTIAPSTNLSSGDDVTASPGSWSGPETPAFGYQWKRCDSAGANCAVISGANQQTYELQAADGNRTIRVTVTATIAGVGSSNATSAPTELVASQGPSLAKDSAPSIRFFAGAPIDGTPVTVDPGKWEGTTPITFSYLWERCNASGDDCALIGNTGASYTPTTADIGFTLRVKVTATNAGGSTTEESDPTPRVAGLAPANVTPPEVRGSPAVGQRLSATAGTWSGRLPIKLEYQWSKCDVLGNCYSIRGANSSVFVPTVDLEGWTIAIRITASNSIGTASVVSAHTATTVAVDAPRATVRPRITGIAAVGQTLSVSDGTWTNVRPSGFAYEWRRCDAKGTPASCVPIPGAAEGTYTVAQDDLGATLRAAVIANSPTGAGSAVSDATTPVRARLKLRPAVSVRPKIVGTVEPGHRLRVSAGVWTGDKPLHFSYSWRRCDATGRHCHAVKGANTRWYHVTRNDAGYTLISVITVQNVNGKRSSKSDPTVTIQLQPSHRGRRLVGTKKANYLPGGGRDDTLIGRGGNDTLVGGAGRDTLIGGPGNDVLDGGTGPDKLYGGPGSDTLLSADGERDRVDCGDGEDRAIVDQLDVVENCEMTQTLSEPTPPSSTSTSTTGTTATTFTTTTTTTTSETETGETATTAKTITVPTTTGTTATTTVTVPDLRR
jgi:hypothetical protein